MAIFCVIVISSIVVSYFYFRHQRNTLLTEKQLELSSISYLKIRQISQWRIERINDGRFLEDNTLLIRKFAEYLKKPGDRELRRDMFQSLRSLTENFEYKNALLIDGKGKPRLSFPPADTLIGDHLKPLLSGIIRDKNIVLTDLHRADLMNFVHLDLVVPLIDRNKNDSLVVGLLTLRIDPTKILYPLLNSWPSLSKSAESLLFRREGEEIVYLSDLRHKPDQQPFMKTKATLTNSVVSMASDGITSTIEGIDYRDVHVVAAMNKIPGTPWYLIAKMDRDEILSELGSQKRMIYIILILVLLATGSVLGMVIRNQRVNYYKDKYQAELDRLAISKHFEYILKFANDIILLTDTDLKIVEANDRALGILPVHQGRINWDEC